MQKREGAPIHVCVSHPVTSTTFTDMTFTDLEIVTITPMTFGAEHALEAFRANPCTEPHPVTGAHVTTSRRDDGLINAVWNSEGVHYVLTLTDAFNHEFHRAFREVHGFFPIVEVCE